MRTRLRRNERLRLMALVVPAALLIIALLVHALAAGSTTVVELALEVVALALLLAATDFLWRRGEGSEDEMVVSPEPTSRDVGGQTAAAPSPTVDGDIHALRQKLANAEMANHVNKTMSEIYTQLYEYLCETYVGGVVEAPVPYSRIPAEYLDAFSMNGRVIIDYRGEPERPGEHEGNRPLRKIYPKFYPKDLIDSFVTKIRRKETAYYGVLDTWLYQAFERYPIEIQNVAVMGSLYPWYEAMCLAYGARPTTVDYIAPNTNHPGVRVITVEELATTSEQFDAAFSLSSFEHDGLTRYGDPLDPNGDLKAMCNMKRVVKPDGLMYFSVPIGRDQVRWPYGRVYGRVRFPLLIESWEIVDTIGHHDGLFDVMGPGHHSLFILRNRCS